MWDWCVGRGKAVRRCKRKTKAHGKWDSKAGAGLTVVQALLALHDNASLYQ
jgi:hypothetical protein